MGNLNSMPDTSNPANQGQLAMAMCYADKDTHKFLLGRLSRDYISHNGYQFLLTLIFQLGHHDDAKLTMALQRAADLGINLGDVHPDEFLLGHVYKTQQNRWTELLEAAKAIAEARGDSAGLQLLQQLPLA